ncbi:hypothetical protein [Psychrobacillus sp. BM2]|uniref:hypothetical protein n=1 Tax=Psychrobacillus sp. BM2 TaxID=3400421 RepID=UPI003B012CEE
MIKELTVKEALRLLELDYYEYKELDNINDIYLNAVSILRGEPYKQYKMNTRLLKSLAEKDTILSKKENGVRLFSIKSVAEYLIDIRLLEQHFIPITEAMRKIGVDSTTSPRYYIQKFLYLEENNFCKVAKLNSKINYNNYFIARAGFETFLKSHISIPEAADVSGINVGSLVTDWVKIQKPIIKFGHARNLHFIDRTEFDEYKLIKLKYRNAKKNGYSRTAAAIELGLYPAMFKKVIEEYSLTPIYLHDNKSVKEYQMFLETNDIEFLKEEQEKLWKQAIENYYTREEAKYLLGLSELSSYYNFTTVPIPALIRIDRDKRLLKRNGIQNFYLKSEIDSYKKKKSAVDGTRDIIYRMVGDPFFVFVTAVNDMNLTFSTEAIETSELWKKYVRRKLKKSKANNYGLSNTIKRLLGATEVLILNTLDKELSENTEKELNLKIFNDRSIPSTFREEIVFFIRMINKNAEKHGKKIFNLNSINYKFQNQDNTNNKTIYTIEEYIMLLDFVSDIDKHKKKAIDETISAIEGFRDIKYASSWLYTLLHLNNAWRHYDITLFPRIDLSRTRVTNLEWLKDNDITQEEAESIVNQVKAMSFIHSKTKKKRYFFCSDELVIPFAYAAIICELKCRASSPHSGRIIDFTHVSRKFKQLYRNEFFSGLEETFQFKSKKMNRTLISYMYNVIKKVTMRNPLEITKFLRTHSDEEVTNIYTDIPQEHIDFITRQLFEVGYFGYAYDILSELLIGTPPDDRLERTNRSLHIKQLFGDVLHLEKTAGYLNALSKEREVTREVLQGYTDKELKGLSDVIKLGQQPAKDEGYHCLFNHCRFEEVECKYCPFAVIHIYTLSQLGITATERVKEFTDKFPKTSKEGEKTRLTNRMYSQLFLIKQAVNRFGDEVVSEYMPEGLKNFREELDKLPSVLEYATIKLK